MQSMPNPHQVPSENVFIKILEDLPKNNLSTKKKIFYH